MAKRLTMVVLFIGAIGLASLITPSTADARGCYRGGGGFYRGGGFYGSPVYGRSYYRGDYYAPYRSYYRGGPGYWGGPGFYYGSPRGGIYFRF